MGYAVNGKDKLRPTHAVPSSTGLHVRARQHIHCEHPLIAGVKVTFDMSLLLFCVFLVLSVDMPYNDNEIISK